MLYIDIQMEDDTDLISGIKSLQGLPDRSKFKKEKVEEEQDESSPLLISEIKKKKKDKKKKKKKEKEYTENNDDSPITTFSSGTLLDVDAILDELEGNDEDVSESIIGDQRKGYGKLKNGENPFKKEFAEEITMLYDLLDEANKFGKELDKIFKAVQGSKARGMSKYTADTATAILSTKQNKLQIIKEIASIKKTIQDLNIKAEAKNKSKEDSSGEVAAAAYLSSIVKYGRNNFLKAVDENGNPTAASVASMVNNASRSDEEDNDDFEDYYLDDELDNYDKLISDRLEEEGNPFRTDLGNKYIENEIRNVSIAIKKCIDSGDWEFIALDKDNQQVFDYPLPSKETIGRIKFSSDSRYATDKLGRSYKVIEYYPDDF